MNQKVLQTLEFDKIRERLSACATTEPGRTRCLAMEPMTDISRIRLAVTETNDACGRIRRCGNLSFSGARDITASLRRLEVGSNLTIREFVSIQGLLQAASRAKAYGRDDNGRFSDEEREPDSLEGYFTIIQPLTPLAEELDRCIASEDDLYDSASPRLHQIRRNMAGINNRIHAQLNSLLASHKDKLQDSVVTMRNGRYCLPVRAEYKNQLSGMVQDQSSSGSTYFIEPMAVIKLNNEMRELEIAEQKEIEVILSNLSSQAAAYTSQLEMDLKALSELDYIFARAVYS
ncbi:MAG: endonuclease MutS2, partial [Lachnospiraceae bacterium]|nr:endonuclease MutS2 [Lachnospiraceae bacterium]